MPERPPVAFLVAVSAGDEREVATGGKGVETSKATARRESHRRL